jgi:hypothetical protein
VSYNPYLADMQAQEQAGQAQQDTPYQADMQAEEQAATSALRGNLTQAVGTNPDQYAQQRRVAGYLGYPTAAVQALPQLHQRAQVQQIDQGTADTPIARKRYTDADFARLAHDDVDALTGLERGFRQFGGGLIDWAGGRARGVGVALDIAHRNIVGAMVDMLPTPRGGAMSPEAKQAAVGPSLGTDWRAVGDAVTRYARNDVMIPADRQSFGDQVLAALGQVGGQALTFPLAGGPAGLYLDGLSAMDEKVAADNAPQWRKDLATLGGAAVTGITERWALDHLLGPIATPVRGALAGALLRIGIGAASEGAQEAAESLGQVHCGSTLQTRTQRFSWPARWAMAAWVPLWAALSAR